MKRNGFVGIHDAIKTYDISLKECIMRIRLVYSVSAFLIDKKSRGVKQMKDKER